MKTSPSWLTDKHKKAFYDYITQDEEAKKLLDTDLNALIGKIAGNGIPESEDLKGLINRVSGFIAFLELADIDVLANLMEIPSAAYTYRDDLHEIIVPGNINRIGAYAFADCPQLETLTIEPGVREIRSGIVFSCPKLKKIILPSSIKKIDPTAFFKLPKKTVIEYAGTKEDWDKIDFEGNSLTNGVASPEDMKSDKIPYNIVFKN